MAAEIPDGCVFVARGILNSSLWTMSNCDRLLAITCICIANWKPRKIWFDKRELIIQRGQFIRSIKQLCEASKLTRQEVKTSINHLISTGFLTRFPMGQSYVYTVCKYDKYQDLSKYSDREWAMENRPANLVSNPALTGSSPGANHKQEGKERKEGGEGAEEGSLSELASPMGDRRADEEDRKEFEKTMEAFKRWTVPGEEYKAMVIRGVMDQGASHEDLREAAKKNGNSDFFAVTDLFRNRKAVMPSRPEQEKKKEKKPPCPECSGRGVRYIDKDNMARCSCSMPTMVMDTE